MERTCVSSLPEPNRQLWFGITDISESEDLLGWVSQTWPLAVTSSTTYTYTTFFGICAPVSMTISLAVLWPSVHRFGTCHASRE
jgi:hypothetical protein